MDPHLQHILLERLAADETLEDGAVDLILAACDSEAELAAALSGQTATRIAATDQLELEAEAPGAYLAAVTVQGFRGVGPATELELTAGPGLTLVVGRNGSGKSSFAEGLELLMTGENRRWSNRTRVWTGGWQNLHVEDQTVLSARLQVDGQPGEMRLERRWERGEALSGGTLAVKESNGEATSLGELGWTAALNRYRPFLSYNELGLMFDELKTMYDALAAILGLEDIETLAKTLRDARLERERAAKGVRDETKRLIEALEPLDDERVTAVLVSLSSRSPDLDAIELALAGEWDAIDPAGGLALLRELSSLRTPDEETVSRALGARAAAQEAVNALAGSDAARAASLAELLESVLRHDAGHRDPACPVCGTAAVIDDAWREHATSEVERLRAEATEVQAALRGLRAAREKVGELLVPSPPRAVALAGRVSLDAGPVEEAWQTWRVAREGLGDEGPAPVRDALSTLRNAVTALAEAAEAALEAREDVWRPVAKTLGAWLPGARAAAASGARLNELKTAETWVKDAAEDLQASRLAPIADQAKANWDALRQESNVALEGFHLRRSGNTRSAEVDVRVDGSDASAFGVMSQGELHALAVSVFLPRASLKESPFRFMVIDDPVQSMDPTKVDGLARVLAVSAKTRQVVVFTHDERLPEAVRWLGIDATVLEVTRRPGSIVEVRTALDPVERYIADARALVREPDLPAEVARRVVPGFCRHALEAACSAAVRRRRLGKGQRHVDVDALLAQATTLNVRLSLALFDDPTKGSQVLTAVNNRYGKKAGDVVVRTNKGVHELLEVDLRDFVRDSASFARELAELK